MRQASRERSGGTALAQRLRARRPEIEQATLTRIYAVSEPPPRSGPEYAEGLRSAVAAGIEYGLEGIERGERSAPPIPDVLRAQARLAARSGVSLDTVLRRYFAGHTLLEDFMVAEAERELGGPELKRLLRSQAAIVDRLLAAVSKAYTEEAERRPAGTESRKAELIERLLAGEPLETTELAYDFDAHHLGLIARGPEAGQALAEIAKHLGDRLLAVRREAGTAWAWLGSRRRLDPGELEELAARELPAELSLAIGEPGEGMHAWRLTHRQAMAAFPVALRSGKTAVRYGDIALLTSLLQDDLLTTSLRQLYIDPLKVGRDEGEANRRTLRAYFAAERNVSSTAISMKVDRKTVAARLRAIEQRIRRPIASCAAELELALSLEELGAESPQTWELPPHKSSH